MKCHDLKHRLESFERKLTEEDLDSLKRAIEIYDSNIKTNNQILDVVLYEKQLYCQKNDIVLNCIANGELLSFMSPTHIYSLFSNAIDNAVEAARQLSDEAKRIIDISVFTQGKYIIIEVSNYFIGERRDKQDLMRTTKADVNHHGYGVKSMRYIVEQYNGKMETNTIQNIFILHIELPINKKPGAKIKSK